MLKAFVSDKWQSNVFRRDMRRWKLSGVRTVGLLLCAFFAFTMAAAGQSAGNFDTGTILGSVTDQTGAVIPHASVTITNTGTGIATTATTSDRGLFTVPALPFGNYVVSALADRFGKASSKAFVLNVGATARVDLKVVGSCCVGERSSNRHNGYGESEQRHSGNHVE